MAPRTDFPPIRACLFDMDGLLLDTEDIYTECINILLSKYGRPPLPWSIKARLQGRPGPQANELFHNWAQLPISNEEYMAEYSALQREHFPRAKALPGVEQLLQDLGRTRYWDVASGNDTTGEKKEGKRVHIALATSSHSANFALKTAHLTDLFSVFQSPHRVLGDDKRIQPGRGKPLGDIYLLALETVNSTLPPGEAPIKPEECLVFEDSVPGVEAGRRAGMRVVWCPHPGLKEQYAGRDAEVLAGRTGEAGVGVDEHQLGEIDDGWAQYLPDLVDFPYHTYGIVVPPKDVESDPRMKETANTDVVAVQEGPKV
ncbi:haloacid dehalogenase-like hydrolase [Diaporthe amygdali]|uniref:haloacid dehalogenase-like hydrolase n=1 Tax=Phomopsis amygdali TaxID=1214568 RepID=UPI0022FF0A5B|nr:haloacid dehalogenase-like hydrolase [Diaporthe amygdali]KAJ0118677.1 haloacid dehalogenase-like hydrolase [Diaporthe amygdali]